MSGQRTSGLDARPDTDYKLLPNIYFYIYDRRSGRKPDNVRSGQKPEVRISGPSKLQVTKLSTGERQKRKEEDRNTYKDREIEEIIKYDN